MRAIAVLSVVAFHAGLPVPGGFVGVDVFFVISGYVITGMLQREWASSGRIQFAAFFVRRFKRLTPALALMVTVTVLISAFTLSPLGAQQSTARTGSGAMLLGANFVIAHTTGGYFDTPAGSNALLNTWSLSVEEQFYLVFPIIVATGWLVGRRSRRLRFTPLFFIASVATISFAIAVVGSTGNTSDALGFYSPLTRAWEFAAGALLALAPISALVASRRLATLLAGSGLALLLASLGLITKQTPFPGVWTLLPVAAALLLLAAGLQGSNPITGTISRSTFTKVGDWSYSIYLWHWPFIVFAAALWPGQHRALVAAALLSLAPALASYRWVEQPIRRLPMMTRPRFARLAVAAIATPLLLALGLWSADQHGTWNPGTKQQLQALSAQHAAEARGCFTKGPFTAKSTIGCEWNASLTGTPIYLVGDSNAAQFSEAVIQAGVELGRPVWIFTTPSCPLIDNLRVSMLGIDNLLPPDVQSSEFDHCAGYVGFTLGWLAHATPGTVVVASLDQYWWDPNLQAELDGGAPSRDSVRKADLLETGLKATISRLQSAGHHVLEVQSIPTYRNPLPIWDPRTCSASSVQRGTCSRQLPLPVIDGLQHASRRAVQEAAQATGASVLDLRSDFCDQVSCSTTQGGVQHYTDAAHITVAESLALATEFANALAAQNSAS